MNKSFDPKTVEGKCDFKYVSGIKKGQKCCGIGWAEYTGFRCERHRITITKCWNAVRRAKTIAKAKMMPKPKQSKKNPKHRVCPTCGGEYHYQHAGRHSCAETERAAKRIEKSIEQVKMDMDDIQKTVEKVEQDVAKVELKKENQIESSPASMSDIPAKAEEEKSKKIASKETEPGRGKKEAEAKKTELQGRKQEEDMTADFTRIPEKTIKGVAGVPGNEKNNVGRTETGGKMSNEEIAAELAKKLEEFLKESGAIKGDGTVESPYIIS
jgi:hypothetical protein